jgi:hypothetical protein
MTSLLIFSLVFWLGRWIKEYNFYNKKREEPTIRLNYADLHEKYAKKVLPTHLFTVFMMFVIIASSTWLFYVTQSIYRSNDALLFDFKPSISSWFFMGTAFMFAFLHPTVNFFLRLVLGKEDARAYLSYSKMRDIGNRIYGFRRVEIPAVLILTIGSVLLLDYYVRIDNKSIKFNTYWGISEEKKFDINQISTIFFYPDIKDDKGVVKTVFHYVLIMKNGFEWNSNTSLDIDSAAFRFLSETSGIKIDTVGKK